VQPAAVSPVRPAAVSSAPSPTVVSSAASSAETPGAAPIGTPVAAPAPPAVTSAGGAMTCPSCGAGLQEADYEGLRISVCASCAGRLAGTGQVERILARREVGFSAEQQHLADLLAADGDQLRRAAVLAHGRPGVARIACPKCAGEMVRRHFDYEHAVEIDYCSICDLYWFEKNELEALQILCERQSG
jgi:Zn-finger nucleic acid-binding protein